MDSGANADGKKVNTTVTEGGLTRCNITSARKTISNVEYTPLRTEIEQGKKISKKKQLAKELTKLGRKAAAPPKEDPEKESGSSNSLDEVECGQLPVKTVEFCKRHRHADDRQGCDRGKHAGKVSRATGTGDDDFDSATGRGLAPLDHALGGAVCRENFYLGFDAELFQNCDCVRHYRPVGV